MAEKKPKDVPAGMNGTYRTVSAKTVHLDSQNPRHTPLEREAEIIAALCDAQLVALATDIANIGSLSPLEVLGVIGHEGLPGHYVAVEGNRRTCALLLLADPSRAPTSDFRESFSRIAKEADVPSDMHVFEFPSRATAQPWIDRRHLGVQGGIGTREWDNASKARAASQSSANTTAKADVLALAVVNHLCLSGHLSEEQRKLVSLTTLSRYLNNASRRAILGLKELDESQNLVYTHEQSEVDATLLHLVLDSLPNADGNKAPVNSRSNASDRDAYVQNLAVKGLIPTTRLEKPIPAVPPPTKATEVLPPRVRSSSNPSDRKKLLEPSFIVKTSDKALRRLRAEMLALPIDDHEFSANYLLRAFLERVLVLYLRRDDPQRAYNNEKQLCQICASDAVNQNAPRRVQQILNQAAASTNFAHSLQTLGTAVHLGTIPVRRQLVAVFDNWDPALRYMLDALESN